MKIRALINQLAEDFPNLTYLESTKFFWSPKDQTIHYSLKDISEGTSEAHWTLLHETGHALLGHTTYQTDFELLKLEAAAWQEAGRLGVRYGITISNNHIQDCLDTYRDWLHARSTCPACGAAGVQDASRLYACNNCAQHWRVSAARFCRPYRRRTSAKQKETGITRPLFD